MKEIKQIYYNDSGTSFYWKKEDEVVSDKVQLIFRETGFYFQLLKFFRLFTRKHSLLPSPQNDLQRPAQRPPGRWHDQVGTQPRDQKYPCDWWSWFHVRPFYRNISRIFCLSKHPALIIISARRLSSASSSFSIPSTMSTTWTSWTTAPLSTIKSLWKDIPTTALSRYGSIAVCYWPLTLVHILGRHHCHGPGLVYYA